MGLLGALPTGGGGGQASEHPQEEGCGQTSEQPPEEGAGKPLTATGRQHRKETVG